MSEGLIIDDNRQTADALQQMLNLLDLPTQVAYGSSAALNALGKIIPRFVCLDINMPGVDGTEVLAYIRREPRLMKVPVIVITADDQPETRQQVLKGGAQAMLIKPATIDALESALKKAGIIRR
ncbi:response regulator [Candidatus Villigracilis saccharophilus]|uniref:response regulator n=1 Tax=Candidatus Villigracilis saccharophilus TaxID=3140684 RepID=UPI003136C944|nr:response regulator [Anaerolineales bacterium]